MAILKTSLPKDPDALVLPRQSSIVGVLVEVDQTKPLWFKLWAPMETMWPFKVADEVETPVAERLPGTGTQLAMEDGAIDQVAEDVDMVVRVTPGSELTTQDSRLLLETKNVLTEESEAVTEKPCGPSTERAPPTKDQPVLADDPDLMVNEVEVPSPNDTPETEMSTLA
jgi:hypothetical protein